MPADPSVAHYVEVGLRALIERDMPRAVGAFASIGRDDWNELAERFPGFPAQFDTASVSAIALGTAPLPIENRPAALDDEPDWTALGSQP